MRSVLLINPNTSAATTAMMVAAARAALPPDIALHGITAALGAAMITDEAALALAAGEVVRLAITEAGGADALVVAAFGDPGVARRRAALAVPVIGIGEAAIREAAKGGHRFGVATTTPGLVRSIEGAVRRLRLEAGFTGVRVPDGDPETLAADPDRQVAALSQAVSACMEQDGATVVAIGGGPLSDAAARLGQQFGNRIVAPVQAAMRSLLRHFAAQASHAVAEAPPRSTQV